MLHGIDVNILVRSLFPPLRISVTITDRMNMRSQHRQQSRHPAQTDSPAAERAARTKLRQDDLFPDKTIIMARASTCCCVCTIEQALLLSQMRVL